MFLFLSTFLCVSLNIGEAVEKLRPDVSLTNKQLIISTVLDRAKKYGVEEEDYPLILAMIKKESNFAHIYGKHGEVGMLQVIPEDPHIMKIVGEISCSNSEKYCVGGVPDVKSNGVLASWKVRKFVSEHPKYALETGFGEMLFWKTQYEDVLKNRYWTKFPAWYFKRKMPDYDLQERMLRWWWNNLTTKAGEYVWISHYNWGSKLITSAASRNYALHVLAIKETI